ncbi:MAG: protein kinase domain-containing protein [Polyangiales bacterium]
MVDASAPTIALPSLRLASGSVFADRYEILGALGEGGMGAVFRVLDLELREEIALKVLRPEMVEVPGALERFRREVKLARRVTHPSVARTFDLGSYQGTRYLTMELIPGESVAKRWPLGRRAPLPEVLRIAADVARGLLAAHAAGVVHRDLKPDNLMLAKAQPGDPAGERVVITDFGIARQAAAETESSATVGIVGTPAYMAPEQLEGRELDGRTDVYALGIVLYELLTGSAPFVGDTVYALAAARLGNASPDPRHKDGTIPEAVAKLVVELLARRREDRPDAEATLARIDALRGGASAAIDRAPRLPSIDAMRAASREPRKVALLPLVAVEDSARELAHELGEALGDAVASVRGLTAIASARGKAAGSGDPVRIGRSLDATYVLEGSVRVAGDDARVRLHLVDVERGIIGWSDRVDGKAEDPFALEDALVRSATEALEARKAVDPSRGGPTDPKIREIWDRAKADYSRYRLDRVRESVAILEAGLLEHPGDAWLMSLLGAALGRVWMQTGASDRDLIARAEEMSLRALAMDPSIGETFHTIATMRSASGDGRAAVRALEEALARVPMHAASHGDLGRLLCEGGFVEEGLRRLELAIRLDPNLLLVWFDIARTHALLGDRQAAEETLAKADAIAGPNATIFPRLRLVFWWRDRALAGRLADVLSGMKTGATWENAGPILRAYAEGNVAKAAKASFERLADDARAAPRYCAFMYELGAEYFGANDQKEEAMEMLEHATELPLIDLLWIDRCPALDCIRDDPRFAKARASVAARVNEMWR